MPVYKDQVEFECLLAFLFVGLIEVLQATRSTLFHTQKNACETCFEFNFYKCNLKKTGHGKFLNHFFVMALLEE